MIVRVLPAYEGSPAQGPAHQQPLQPWSLCPACGGALAPVAKAQVADQLEPGTLRTQQQFSHCRSCGQVYWHGAHDARLQQLVRRYT